MSENKKLTASSLTALHKWANMQWLEANKRLNTAKLICDSEVVEKYTQERAMFNGVMLIAKELKEKREGLQELFSSLQRIDATLKN